MGKTAGPFSKYMQIYCDLIDGIVDGTYPLGSLIPTQNELSAHFGVSRATVREAIKELCRRGILKTVKGKGTIVTETPKKLSSLERESGLSQGRNKKTNMVTSRVVEISVVPADKHLSQVMMVPRYTLLTKIVRVRLVNQMPACLDQSYIVNKYVESIDFFKADLEKGSLYQLLRQKAGITVGYIEEKFRAVGCPENVALNLEILQGEPVLNLRRVSYDELGNLVEYCNNYERSDVYYSVVQTRSAGQLLKPVWNDSRLWGSLAGVLAAAILWEMETSGSEAESSHATQFYSQLLACLQEVCNQRAKTAKQLKEVFVKAGAEHTSALPGLVAGYLAKTPRQAAETAAQLCAELGCPPEVLPGEALTAGILATLLTPNAAVEDIECFINSFNPFEPDWGEQAANKQLAELLKKTFSGSQQLENLSAFAEFAQSIEIPVESWRPLLQSIGIVAVNIPITLPAVNVCAGFEEAALLSSVLTGAFMGALYGPPTMPRQFYSKYTQYAQQAKQIMAQLAENAKSNAIPGNENEQ